MLVIGKLPGTGPHLCFGIQDVLLGFAKAYARELEERPLMPFYHAGIKYRPEDPSTGVEEWADPYTVMERGYGDCDDMVLWRLAEILKGAKWRDGQPLPAWPAVAQKLGTEQYHVVVRHRSGKVEDPAAKMQELYGDG